MNQEIKNQTLPEFVETNLQNDACSIQFGVYKKSV